MGNYIFINLKYVVASLSRTKSWMVDLSDANNVQSDPVIPAFPDLHLSPAAIMKELSSYFPKFASQARLLALPAPHELQPREVQEYPFIFIFIFFFIIFFATYVRQYACLCLRQSGVYAYLFISISFSFSASVSFVPFLFQFVYWIRLLLATHTFSIMVEELNLCFSIIVAIITPPFGNKLDMWSCTINKKW